MLDLNLFGKRALVCGASQGIGRATAMELADLGCDIIALAREEDGLKDLMPALAKHKSQQHVYICSNLLDLPLVERQIKSNLKKDGTIDIVINNSGGPVPGPILEAKDEQFEDTFKMHLLASALLARCLVPGMKAKQYGRIINIISTSVKAPIENLGVSNTIRWAVAAWVKTLSYEVAKFGITVNSVLPGSTDTARLASIIKSQAEKRGVDEQIVRQEMIAQIPAGRIGFPEEVARVIAFLASPAASYVNGVALQVDGGRLRTL